MLSTEFKVKIHTPSGEFSTGLSSPVKRDSPYKHATKVTERSITYASGKTETWYEVTTNPNLQKWLAARYGDKLDDPELINLLAALCRDIEQNAGKDDRDWEKIIARADLLSQKFNERGYEGQDPIALARIMGLSSVLNSHTPPAENSSEVLETSSNPESIRQRRTKKRTRNGQKGMTPLAKRSVRSSAAIFEERYGRECLSFGTFTLPVLEYSEHHKISSEWPAIMKTVRQNLERLLVRRGLPGEVLIVTEIQEKRYRQWKVICLHAHVLFPGRKSKLDPWAISKDEFRNVWQVPLENRLGRPVDCRYATRIEAPRKSLKAEMGKYITKGGKLLDEIVQSGKGDWLPTAWWNCSESVRKEERDRRITLTGEIPRKLWQNLTAYKEAGLIWFSLKYITFTCPVSGIKRDICVGASGRFLHDWILPALMRGDDPLEIAASQHQGSSVSKIALVA